MKRYDAIYFDWDGTAVLSRGADARGITGVMEGLLRQGVCLIVVSGTTYENIAGGRLHELIAPDCLDRLFLGLGRGAYQYGFSDGQPILLKDMTPNKATMEALHRHCFALHEKLYHEYDYNTDIVFCRTNYCKLDLLPGHDRGDKLFLQDEEVDMVQNALRGHGVYEGLRGLIRLAGVNPELPGVRATADAKHLEVGFTTKGDNVDYFVGYLRERFGILPENCAFLGDEFADLDEGVDGSDALMRTPRSLTADFFDVSEGRRKLPKGVVQIGGGVERFRDVLLEQTALHSCQPSAR